MTNTDADVGYDYMVNRSLLGICHLLSDSRTLGGGDNELPTPGMLESITAGTTEFTSSIMTEKYLTKRNIRLPGRLQKRCYPIRQAFGQKVTNRSQ